MKGNKKNRYRAMEVTSKKSIFNKTLFTLLMVMLFSGLSLVPTPFVNTSEMVNSLGDVGIFQLASLFSGRAMNQLTFMATGISSYVTASIVVQVMTYLSDSLDEISKSPNGEKTIKKINLILGFVLAIFTSVLYTRTLAKSNPHMLANDNFITYTVIALTHGIGTICAILIGEAITEKGYGNGISLLISANIILQLPGIISAFASRLNDSIGQFIIILLLVLFMIYLIVKVESSYYHIPVAYAKSSARTGKSEIHDLEVKVNSGSTMPIIFATSIVQFIALILTVIPWEKGTELAQTLTNPASIAYSIIFLALLIAFTFLYGKLTFNTIEISESLRKQGASIVGIRPGRPTKNYLDNVSSSLLKVSALYLFIVAIIPLGLMNGLDFFGVQATSVMILIGSATDVANKFLADRRILNMKF